jgi:hypothetical protein
MFKLQLQREVENENAYEIEETVTNHNRKSKEQME